MSARMKQNQKTLQLPLSAATNDMSTTLTDSCALEDNNFPFDAISDIAEIESWRKEINRPIYHIHKWWAQRLGTVFRAITLGALMPSGTDIMEAFYQPTRLTGKVVFDPFMGSGTTLGEALKLGSRVIGRDINPVAHFLVKTAFSEHNRELIMETFEDIKRDVAEDIKSYYKARLDDGTEVDVLYFFWVKCIDCPECSSSVELFSSRIFARHAYPRRHPVCQCVCPSCGDVISILYDAQETTCLSCLHTFNPQSGTARGQKATCPKCSHSFRIAKTAQDKSSTLEHKLYAKLVLLPNGEKCYMRANDADRYLYDKSVGELAKRANAYPVSEILPGHNSNQAIGYNYRYWHQMFNDRQLLCLSILADRIREIPDLSVRELFTCLFSGVLEFNNLFTSYKGEGTGAVRHMFAHHILKPERVPLEANLWGTSKSSGSFSTMFHGRIRRALDYAANPFELHKPEDGKPRSTRKIFGLSEPLGFEVGENYSELKKGRRVVISCGDSKQTDLEDGSVDAVISDPPFFDNVHYSELADFFYVWQRHILGAEGPRYSTTTRSSGEVQSVDASEFTNRLLGVWSEAHRVLVDNGVLVFTYHHSRSEGWRSVLDAVVRAGFCITAAHPVKAEMSVAMPKAQAKEPIDLDIIVVCRKRGQWARRQWDEDQWDEVLPTISGQIERFGRRGRRLSRNDVRVVVMAQMIRQLSQLQDVDDMQRALETNQPRIEAAIEELHALHDCRQEEVGP